MRGVLLNTNNCEIAIGEVIKDNKCINIVFLDDNDAKEIFTLKKDDIEDVISILKNRLNTLKYE